LILKNTLLLSLFLWAQLAHGASVRHGTPVGNPSSGVANPTASGVLSNPALLGEIQGFEVFTEGSLMLRQFETTTTRNEGIDPNTDSAYRPSKTSQTTPIGQGAVAGKMGQWGWGFFVSTPIHKGANFEETTPGSAPTSHQRYAVLQAEIQSIDFGVASGIQILDWLSIGFAPHFSLDRFSLKNSWDTMGLEGLGPSPEEAGKLYPYTGDALFDYTGQGHHWGASVGLFSDPVSWLSLGASWEFNAQAQTKGQGELTLPELIGGEVIAFRGATSMPLASVLRGGLLFQPNPRVEIAIEAQIEMWKNCCSKRANDALLEMTNDNGEALGPENGVSVSLDKEHYIPQRFLNAPGFSIGGLWTSAQNKLSIGGQATWERNAVPDFAANALNIDFESFGAGGFVGLRRKSLRIGLRADVRKNLAREISNSAWDIRLVALSDDRTNYVDERFSPSLPYTASGNGQYESFSASMSLSLSWTPDRSQ
jgi:hypothetical protein